MYSILLETRINLCKAGETGRNIFPLLGHLPNGHNGKSWAGTEPIQNHESFFLVFQMAAGAQGFVPSSTAFSGHRQEAGWDMKQPEHELATMQDASTCNIRIYALSHCVRP